MPETQTADPHGGLATKDIFLISLKGWHPLSQNLWGWVIQIEVPLSYFSGQLLIFKMFNVVKGMTC